MTVRFAHVPLTILRASGSVFPELLLQLGASMYSAVVHYLCFV